MQLTLVSSTVLLVAMTMSPIIVEFAERDLEWVSYAVLAVLGVVVIAATVFIVRGVA